MAFDTPHDSSGTVVSWPSTATVYTVTNIVVTFTDPAADDKLDISHLGLTTGNSVLTIDRPLQGSATDTGREVVIDYIGKTLINDASTGTLTITVGGTSLISKAGTVTTSTLTLATNDAIRGQATFKIAR
jgi:hypothetical protein